MVFALTDFIKGDTFIQFILVAILDSNHSPTSVLVLLNHLRKVLLALVDLSEYINRAHSVFVIEGPAEAYCFLSLRIIICL